MGLVDGVVGMELAGVGVGTFGPGKGMVPMGADFSGVGSAGLLPTSQPQALDNLIPAQLGVSIPGPTTGGVITHNPPHPQTVAVVAAQAAHQLHAVAIEQQAVQMQQQAVREELMGAVVGVQIAAREAVRAQVELRVVEGVVFGAGSETGNNSINGDDHSDVQPPSASTIASNQPPNTPPSLPLDTSQQQQQPPQLPPQVQVPQQAQLELNIAAQSAAVAAAQLQQAQEYLQDVERRDVALRVVAEEVRAVEREVRARVSQLSSVVSAADLSVPAGNDAGDGGQGRTGSNLSPLSVAGSLSVGGSPMSVGTGIGIGAGSVGVGGSPLSVGVVGVGLESPMSVASGLGGAADGMGGMGVGVDLAVPVPVSGMPMMGMGMGIDMGMATGGMVGLPNVSAALLPASVPDVVVGHASDLGVGGMGILGGQIRSHSRSLSIGTPITPVSVGMMDLTSSLPVSVPVSLPSGDSFVMGGMEKGLAPMPVMVPTSMVPIPTSM
ncbi:hypothetical protein HK097_004447, partial [Rhizophlyctis rosea]